MHINLPIRGSFFSYGAIRGWRIGAPPHQSSGPYARGQVRGPVQNSIRYSRSGSAQRQPP